MDRVGGYLAYQALLQDAPAYADVLTAMAGEADAMKWMQLAAKAKGGR